MRMRSAVSIFVFLAISVFTQSPFAQAKNNQVLANAYIEDQLDRKAMHSSSMKAEQVIVRDRERRRLVMEFLKAGKIQSGDDYYAAAMVFQHGESPSDYRIAHALSTLSASLSGAPSETSWLMAASWDRLMHSMGRPQWYGTQYVTDAKGHQALLPIDMKAVSDAERRRLRIFLPGK